MPRCSPTSSFKTALLPRNLQERQVFTLKKRLLLFLFIFFFLWPYHAFAQEKRILVYIEDGEGFAVTQNGLSIFPGEDAVFEVKMERSVALTGTDYPGGYTLDTKDRTVTLTLRNVLYPTRVRLTVSTKYCTVLYDANGGQGEPVEKRYSLSTHPRPNTEINLFARNGYTLLCWNTRSDGMGERIGLGSRVTPVNGRARLYAQWVKWNDEDDFDWEGEEAATITGYHGSSETLVIPGTLGGKPVTGIAAGAFVNCMALDIVLPPQMRTVEDGAFQRCAVRALTLFDSVETISDASLTDCPQLQTLYINAAEAPFGYVYRKESMYADKAELLIKAQGKKKMVFYGGCSMWYSLDAIQADKLFGDEYTIINMGLNGTVSSAVQMQIMTPYLEEGDILFHAPETSSKPQLMLFTDMGDNDSSLWTGLENNYDLFTLVDLRTVGGALSSLCHYLGLKDKRTDYQQSYTGEDYRTSYLDAYGSIPFYRSGTEKTLADDVSLLPERVSSLETLAQYYAALTAKGISIYVSYGCINMDDVPEEQRGNVDAVDAAFHESIAAMDGPVLISRLSDYLYQRTDFYDTNYHLCSEPAKRNTAQWMNDLVAQRMKEGGEEAE